MFVYGELLDGLRCHTTEWLSERREWLVREQRRLHVEELAVLRVLDERGRIDDATAQGTGGSRLVAGGSRRRAVPDGL